MILTRVDRSKDPLTQMLRQAVKRYANSIKHLKAEAERITADGSKIVTASFSDYTLKVWSMETGENLGTFYGHDNQVLSVAITPDGTRAISHTVEAEKKV